jgi:transposase
VDPHENSVHERILKGPQIESALRNVDRGIPRKEVSDLFGLSLSTIKRWLKRRRQTGDLNIHKIPGRPSVKGKVLRQWLPSQLKSNPDLTLREHCEAFEDESGMKISEATMSRNIEPGFQVNGRSKKVEGSPRERDEGARALWRWLSSRFDVRRLGCSWTRAGYISRWIA